MRDINLMRNVSLKFPYSILIGKTGFVGINLSEAYDFSASYHSVDVTEAYGKSPDLLVYAGIPGTKFMANMHPDDDRDIVINAAKNIQRISPKKTVLISTIDVYDKFGVDETYIPKASVFGAYGENRIWLEKWTLENLQDVHIIRLPAIYGKGIKKNFVYDLINVAPAMLDEESYLKVNTWRDISSKYKKKKDGYFYLKEMTAVERNVFIDAPLNAFSYTDSRNQYQFYSLKHLWEEICFAIEHGIRILNIVTEPIGASELYKSIYGTPFLNKKAGIPIKYDVRSCYCGFYQRSDGYFYSRDYVLNELTMFIRQEIRRLGMQ